MLRVVFHMARESRIDIDVCFMSVTTVAVPHLAASTSLGVIFSPTFLPVHRFPVEMMPRGSCTQWFEDISVPQSVLARFGVVSVCIGFTRLQRLEMLVHSVSTLNCSTNCEHLGEGICKPQERSLISQAPVVDQPCFQANC